MRKVFLGAAALSMILATGCQNEELVQQTSANEYSLTLDMSAGSRTLHNEAGHCVWGDNEALYVVGDGGKVYGKLTMKSKSEGGKKAVFSGKVMGDPGKLQYMVYPVPQADGTIPMGEIDGANHNAPMTGIINRGVVSDVDYAGGLVKIPVKGTNDIAINAENKDGKVVTGGSYTFDPETGKLTFNANSGSVVTITNIPENGSVYVPVETDVQEGSTDETEKIIVDVTTGEGSNQQTQSFEAEVQEGAVTTNNVPSIEVDEESGAVNATVTTKEQLLSAIAAGGYVKLKADITAKEIITISSNVVLDGNGHTLTSSATRAINIETTDTVTINNLKIVAKERAINIINKRSTVNLNDVKATAYNNAVMIATSAGAVRLTVENCDFTGLAVVNIAGAGTTADIIDTKITNVDATDKESYGAITLSKTAAKASVIVSGGVITVADDSRKAYVFPGDASVTGVDDIGYIVATIGDAGYETLNEAVEDVKEAGTIELIRDINVSEAVLVEKDCTIDMNGKTLTSAGDGFEVISGTLTLTGNGTVNAGTVGGTWVAVWANGGNAVIENGTYSVVEGKDGSTNDCIYAKGGQITINGGTFSNTGTYYPNMGGVVINANNDVAGSKVIIKGGTFNPAEGCVAYEQADINAGRITIE